MASYLRKYLIKPSLFISSILIILTAGVTLLVNIFLVFYNQSLTEQVSDFLGRKVSIGSAVYLPPNLIVLKKVSICKDASGSSEILVSIEKIRSAFSLGQFVQKKNVTITNLSLINPRGDYSKCVSFLTENFEQIIEFLMSLPREEVFRFIVNSGRLRKVSQTGLMRNLVIDATLKIRGDLVYSHGSLYMESIPESLQKSKPKPLHYRVSGSFLEDGFEVGELEFGQADSYAKLWGTLEQDILKLNGFLSIAHVFDASYPQEPTFDTIDKLHISFLRRRSIARLAKSSASRLNIFNIECEMYLKLPEVEIENITFSVNDVPFRLQGIIVFSEPVAIDLTCSAYPDQKSVPEVPTATTTGDFTVHAQGEFHEEKISGKLDVIFPRTVKEKKVLEEAKITFKNLTFHFLEKQLLNMQCEEAFTVYNAANGTHELLFKDFHALFDPNDTRFKFVYFNSTLYDGFLEGEGYVDLAQKPTRFICDLVIKDASSNNLSVILTHLSQVYGTLYSRIHFRSYPQSHVKGTITVQDGYLDDFEFFKWLADFFRIPSLHKVYFDTLSVNFLADDNVGQLENINLDSQDVTLEGYFHVYVDDLVSSKLSLGLSRETLATSPKFRPLLRILGGEFSRLDFDFQLSGLLDRMNFKWLESDFKRRLQDSIPDFIERGIEKKVEGAIGSISEEQ
ncbi:MAG: hypothetical protein JSW40_08750 [Candidatus Omnitrophota bacterium]|nr:MAG: hypothetical protein JSW40_08750 [Candidatus Omnitrophota bacterium]